MIRIILIGIFISGLLINHVAAGSIGYTSISSYMDWEPDCYKPSTPSFYVSDRDSFNWAVDEYNNYVSEVERYINCIKGEAEDDISALSQAVSNGFDDKRSEILSELDSAKSDLEMQRSYLRY